MKRPSLRLKLVLGLLLIGSTITVLTSAAQVYWDYHKELDGIETEFSAVATSSLPALEAAMWALDTTQVQLLLDGIIALPKIQQVQVVTERKIYAARGQLPDSHPSMSRTFAIIHRNGEQHELGELNVYASLKPVYAELWRRAGFIFVANALRTLLVALLIGVFFERFVTRHVRWVARYLDKPFEVQRSPLYLARAQHKRDELDELADSVNQLYTRLYSYRNELTAEKNRYHALVENNPEAIWRCEMKAPISIDGDASLLVTALQQNAIVAEVNQAAVVLARTSDAHSLLGASWRKLPFIVPRLWQDLVDNGLRLKEVASNYVDDTGVHHHFSNSLTCLVTDGHLHTVWGISVDVTERIGAQKQLQQREQELQQNQARLAEAQALAHMGHWVYQSDTKELQASDEFIRIYGFARDCDGVTWSAVVERIHPEDREHILQALTDPSVDAAGAEHRIVWPSGEQRHVQAIARKRIEHGSVISTFGIIMDVTDQRRAEEDRRRSQQALIESEARMAEAQSIAHMGHWIMDNQTHTFSASDEFYRLHGHAPQAFPAEIRTFVQQIHPDDRPRIKAILNHLDQQPRSEDYRIIRPDGQVRYMRGTITPFYSGGRRINRVFGITMDITERKLAEIDLQTSQELFSKAFAASPDGIAFVDKASKRIIRINEAFAEISGYSESSLVGSTISLLDNDDKHRSLSYVLEQSEQAHNVEIKLEKRTGSSIICLLSWRPIDLRGRQCTLAMLRDVTALRELEQTAEQQQKQLLRAEKLASLGTMVAGVAHEINNPNHLIQMNADLLENFSGHLIELAEEAAQKYPRTLSFNGMSLDEILATTPELLSDIKASSRRIDRIVKDLKDFSRPRDNAEFLPVNLNHIIRKARTLLASTLDARPQRVCFELCETLPLIQGDSQRLEQVIVNLVTNALDASPEDGTITIKTYADNQQLICDVIDEGYGISAENIKHIFDPFFTTKQDIGGTGLGLAISFRLIREHQGQLEAISELGTGTTMRICLPLLTQCDATDTP